MTQGSALRSPRPTRYVNVEPRLQLLVLLEPRYRVFFRNLFDLVLRRKVPPFFLASQPAQCSRNYYVRTGVRWQAVAESLAWHLAATPLLLMVWTWSMQWDSMSYPLHQAHISHGKYQLTYYKPGETFPARDGRQHQKIKPQQHAPSEPPAIHVASEQQRLGVAAPDVPLTGNVQAEIASADPTLPAVPLSATARSQLTLPANYSEAVAPSPGTGRLSMRALGSLGAAVVAPVPQIASIRGSGGVSLPEAVVSPAPTLRGSSRRGGMGNNEIGSVTVVRPSPQLAGGVARGSRLSREFGIGGMGTLAAAIVPPPPSISGRAFVPGGSGNSLNGAGVQVVAPSPALAHGVVLASGRGDSLRGSGAQVVPPAPALRGHAFRAGSAGGSSSHSGGVQVVGPSPSLGSGVVLARRSGHSLGGDGTQVVPPAPSLAGTGGFAGAGGNGSSGAIVGAVVPPAPSVGGIAIQAGNGGGGGFGSLTGDGTQVVAPAPAIASSRVFAGSGGNGGTALSDSGSQVLPPGSGAGGQGTGTVKSGANSNGSAGSGLGPGGNRHGASSGAGSSTQTIAGLSGAPSGAGVGARSGQPSTPIISAAIPKHPEIPDFPAGKTGVLPLRVVQLALALPMSSYFSNYEAFVAERSVNRDTTQLIKLVYIFLPYQRRLTEFGVNTSKTFNLRVTRDPSCDESLISMTWPEGETQGKPSESDKDKLPCYRTTADDYRKAWEKAR